MTLQKIYKNIKKELFLNQESLVTDLKEDQILFYFPFNNLENDIFLSYTKIFNKEGILIDKMMDPIEN